MNERLSQLIEKFHDGELSAGESAELEELLRSDAEARGRFVEQCMMEV